MSFQNFKVLTGTIVTVFACAGAILPASARPLQPSDAQLYSQVNQPAQEGVPRTNTAEVRGRIVSISGDQVQVRTASGTSTYTISQQDQERNNLAVGEDVVLLVRDNTVIAVNPPASSGAEGSAASGSAGSAGSAQTSQSGTSSSTQSSSSTTVIRRQSTTQPQPAPTTAQTRPAPQPAPQPVRGLW